MGAEALPPACATLGRRRQRGFSATEGLVASAILALAITGMFGLWSGMFRRIGRAREASQAAQIARAEIERAKVFGTDNLPTGTYDAGTKSATWTGAYSTANNAWASGATAYFSVAGARLPSSAGALLKLQTSIVDSNVLPKTGGYTFQLESRRSLIVTVRSVASGAEVFKVATVVVAGGL